MLLADDQRSVPIFFGSNQSMLRPDHNRESVSKYDND